MTNELEIVLKWCEKWQESNSNKRCFKTFRSWVQAASINGKVEAKEIEDEYFKAKIKKLENIINKSKLK